jgi:N-acetylglucosaminyl-diphospho-decaprenol L-rhamnosyltransferase
MSELSIITVTYQSAAKIGAYLDAAQTAAPSAELVVVDNASTDDTRELVQAASGNIRLLRAGENVGFGRGCNLGAENAQGQWLLFLNPDVLLQSVSIPTIDDGASFGLGAGLIAPSSEDPAAPGVRANATHVEDWIQEVWKLFAPRPISRHLNARRRPPHWPVGGMFMARRDEYHRIGGFDARYFLYFEDRDLGRRYRNQHLPVHVIEGLAGIHQVGSSSEGVASWRREAWSIISWLEYMATWSSPDQAAATAGRVLTVLTGLSRLADRQALPDRVRSKATSAGLIAEFVMDFDDFLPGDPQSYYMGARQAIATAKRPGTA